MILCPKGPYFNSAKCQQQQLLLVLHAAATEDAGNLGEKRGQLEVFYTHRPFRHIALCVAPASSSGFEGPALQPPFSLPFRRTQTCSEEGFVDRSKREKGEE